MMALPRTFCALFMPIRRSCLNRAMAGSLGNLRPDERLYERKNTSAYYLNAAISAAILLCYSSQSISVALKPTRSSTYPSETCCSINSNRTVTLTYDHHHECHVWVIRCLVTMAHSQSCLTSSVPCRGTKITRPGRKRKPCSYMLSLHTI